jgi:hypothetical protein
MAWRDLAADLDAEVVHTFDETGVTLQKMAAGQPSGAPIAVPAEFDAAYIDQSLGPDGVYISTTRPVAWLHYADLPAGVAVAIGDRLIAAAPSPNAGTYTVDSLEPNSDKTGVMLRLKVSRTR